MQAGEYQKGYLYELIGSERSYSPHNPADQAAYEYPISIDPTYHFSLIALYEDTEKLYADFNRAWPSLDDVLIIRGIIERSVPFKPNE